MIFRITSEIYNLIKLNYFTKFLLEFFLIFGTNEYKVDIHWKNMKKYLVEI